MEKSVKRGITNKFRTDGPIFVFPQNLIVAVVDFCVDFKFLR